MTDYFDALETRSIDQRTQDQLTSLQQQIRHAQQNSSAYARILENIDANTIVDASSFTQLPLTRKSELIELQKRERPFGGFDAKTNKPTTHVFASPGPIYEPGYQVKDHWHFARTFYAAGFRAGDLVHNTFSYHFVPAGMMVESGAITLGCRVIPAGTGQTELQIQTINDLQPNGYVGTPSFLKIILDKATSLDADVSSIKKALVSGEALPPSIRADFQEQGLSVQQCYATADLGVIGYESSALEGLIIDESVYVEIVRPGSSDLVAEGEVGEVVVTRLSPQYPLIRFATGDLSAVLPGESPCGRTNLRIKGWMGRADQTAKVRGMFIHPEQIDKVVKRHTEITRARLVVNWVDKADQMTLQCEVNRREEPLLEAIANSFREICKLRCEVELVNSGELVNDGKVIDDARDYD
ncbi:MAG: phenylacetate-CoA ligase [Gammaproteobacteria bacterium]|jgi:phenylacetate-CoA ligase